MRRRSVILAAGWAAVTVVATLVAWRGVSVVADEVTEARPSSLSDDEVARAASEHATSTPSTTATPGTEPPVDRAIPAPTAPSPTAPPATTAATPPPPPPAPDQTRTYDLVGGTVVVHFHGNGTVSLVSSQPKPGFERELHDAGPGKVDVEFESEGHESRLVARWEDGTPSGDVSEEADGDGGKG